MKPALIAAVVLAALMWTSPRIQGRQNPILIDECAEIRPTLLGITIHPLAQSDASDYEVPHWYQSSEWILVIVGMVTALVIGWQSYETRRAAQAAKINAEALVNSERAWILTDIGWAASQPNQPEPTKLKISVSSSTEGEATSIWVCWNWKNDGRTPAWITDKLLWVRVYDEAPPSTPDTSDPLTFSGREPVGVGEKSRIFLTPWFKGERPETAAALIVYGVIKYRDVFGAHETWCGYSVEGASANPRLERLVGYPEYNKST